ncbi:Gfo/Idh/MocA family oxidoreductase [Gordonia sp. NB41Y]|uniref:Gfo/Idh/MocA family protein n=1 Tax=Gordonia sp. NB41Y TaxID=875808 RepID=UPI0006B1BD0F|nr:Gfo/Idh/MocA family oxidoreductase [Gordonia sp. NB41Y]EMP11772.2 oxidoreductase [Gordonia sp. NB41Y]WLP90755.1 Gfo/Idh/MocA family oxidoreductase [Gordonia sp. NB41Y]
MTLRIAIIGCGKVAGNHARALRQVDGVELIACCDTQIDRAQRFAADHGIPGARDSIDAVLALRPDAITVCTPHPAHESAVVAAAEAGVHVLCEKPIAVDLAAADRMIAATERAGVIFGVVFQRRLWPAAQRIRAAIDDGRIGTPILGEVSVLLHRPTGYYASDPWRGRWDTDGGGVLMTQAIHQIDLLQWFCGTPVSVTGFIRTHTHGEHIETEDSASAVVAFESGATATITATTALSHNLGNRVTVVGAGGATGSVLEFPEGHEGVTELWTVEGEVEFTPVFRPDVPAHQDIADINSRLTPFHILQIQDFVDAVREGRRPMVTGADARTSLAIVTAIYESARTGRPVEPARQERGVLS